MSVVIEPRERPVLTKGTTTRISTGCGHLFTVQNDDDQGPIEVFCILGKSGGCAAAQLEALGRMVSLAYRYGIAPDEIAEQLRGIRCPNPHWDNGIEVLSCPDAVSHAICGEFGGEKLPTIIYKESVCNGSC